MVTHKNQKGQSLVEFALLLPVFILILFGVMEFGRLWEMTNMLTSAAREGARVAAVTTPDITKTTNAAQNILSAGNIQNATITVSGPNLDNEITVTVSIAYTPMTGFIIPNLGPYPVSRSTTIRWEG